MAYPLARIDGIGRREAEALAAVGIRTTEDLLEAAARPKGRAALAEQTGIAEDTLLAWANRADLLRIAGLGTELAALLAAAGVTSVPELKRQRPDVLAAALQAANAKRKRLRRAPGEAQCAKLIAAAKTLRRRLSY
jgi:predicted flap endonuclease-1-like 5' DNA nuclease